MSALEQRRKKFEKERKNKWGNDKRYVTSWLTSWAEKRQ
jgi:hypothetical protein